jgi:hypothetical protein
MSTSYRFVIPNDRNYIICAKILNQENIFFIIDFYTGNSVTFHCFPVKFRGSIPALKQIMTEDFYILRYNVV